MIIDGRQSASQPQDSYDLAIIGSGPAGITLAMELADTGLRIALLESGGLEFDGDAQELNDGELSALDETDLMAGRLRMLGGTSNHWGGHCLPLDPIDFSRRPLSGLSGWTVSYDDMVPFYERAHVYCDLGGFGYDPAQMKGLKRDPWLLDGDDRIETTTILQSAPTRFGEKYQKQLEQSQTIDVFLWTTATGIDIGPDGQATGIIAKTIDGQDRKFEAKRYVLAGGAVENARFLLANNARLGASFGNAGELLGKCFMDHTVGGLAFLHFDTPVQPKAYWSHAGHTSDGVDAHFVWRLRDEVLEAEELNNTQMFLIPFSEDEDKDLARDAGQGLSALKSIAKWGLGREDKLFSLSDSYCTVIQNADAMAVHKFKTLTNTADGVRRALLRYETEQLPTRDSYVALDDSRTDAFGMPLPRLNWSPSLQDRDSLVRTGMVVGQAVGAAGLGRIEMEDHFDARYWDASTAWHHLGTTRLSESETDGAVNADLRLHGTDNVYVAGGSVFPSGGRANPTLTIVALSVRLADHLRATQGKG